MFQFVREFLVQLFVKMHFPENAGKFFAALIILAGFIVVALVLYQLIYLLFRIIVKWRLRKKENAWIRAMLEQRFFGRFALMLPSFFIFRLIPSFFVFKSASFFFFLALAGIYQIVAVCLMLCAFVDSFMQVMAGRDSLKGKPVKSYSQIFKIIFWTIGTILIICIIVNKSPGGLLAGIGAFSAVLLLVFQDTITGFVQSVQLSSNHLVKVGDWISCEEAYGIVEEVHLVGVKVRNFDNTLISVPVGRLVKGTFQNWRDVLSKNMRRVYRAIPIDVNTIQPCTAEMLQEFSHIHLVKAYVAAQQKKLDAQQPDAQWLNQNVVTNLDVFRIYVENYLRNHPGTHPDGLLMVRQLDPEENGLPLQIYCFTKTIVWKEYEDLQSEYLNHVVAAMPAFHLRAFQRSSDHPSISGKEF